MNAIPVALVILATLAPAVSAAETPSLLAKSVRTTDAARLEGTPQVFRTNGTGAAPTGRLNLEAATMRLDLQGERDDLSVLGGDPNAQTYRDETPYTAVHLHATRLGPQLDILIAGASDATAVVQAVGAAVNRPSSPTLAPRDYVVPDDAAPIAIDGSLAATTASGFTLDIRGDFTLRLWDIDATIEAAEGTRDVRTGARYTDRLGEPGGIKVVGTTDASEAILSVQDGHLTLILDGAVPAVLVSSSLALSVTGQVALEGVVSQPSGTVGVDGDLRIDARPAGDAIAVQLGGNIERATAGGTPIVLVPASPHVAGWWGILVPVLFLLAATSSQNIAWRRRMERLRAAMVAEDYAAAAASFGPLLLSRRHRADAVFLGTLALARMERHEDALRLLGNRGLWRRNAPGIRRFLMAHAHLALGRGSEARLALADALIEAPELEAEARDNPSLATLLPPRRLPMEGYT